MSGFLHLPLCHLSLNPVLAPHSAGLPAALTYTVIHHLAKGIPLMSLWKRKT